MNNAKAKLADILREAIVLLRRPENDFAWSSWNDAGEAIAELSEHVTTLDAGSLPPKHDLSILFAPTGPIQDVSISSGWGDEFLALAERFDRALNDAYRWSIIHAIRITPPSKRRERVIRLRVTSAILQFTDWSQPWRFAESVKRSLGDAEAELFEQILAEARDERHWLSASQQAAGAIAAASALAQRFTWLPAEAAKAVTNAAAYGWR